jgi:hypothetical protein
MIAAIRSCLASLTVPIEAAQVAEENIDVVLSGSEDMEVFSKGMLRNELKHANI